MTSSKQYEFTGVWITQSSGPETRVNRINRIYGPHCGKYSSAGNTWDERSLFRVWFPQLIDPAGLP